MTDESRTIAVLHVDDDPEFGALTAAFLEREDDRFAVETATSTREGLDRFADAEYDCIVSDFDMPERSGLEFLEAVRDRDEDVPFVLFTGHGSERIASEAISAGVSDYLQKDPGSEQYTLLANRIRTLVAKRRTESDLETRAGQQQVLATLGQHAVAETDLETLFDEAAESVADALDTECVSVFDWRPDEDDLRLLVAVGRCGRADGEATVDASADTLAGVTLESREPVVVEDLRSDGRFDEPREAADRDAASGVGVLVGPSDRPWGVLAARTTRRRRFTETDVAFLRNVATLLANAVTRAEREQEIRTTKRTLETVIESSPDAIVAANDDRITQIWNSAAERMFGWTKDEVLDRPLPHIPDDEQDRFERRYREVSDEESVIRFETRRETKDGDRLDVAVSAAPVRDVDGTVISNMGIVRDLTEQKARERAFEESKARNRSLTEDVLDASPAGTIVLDSDFEVVWCDELIEEYVGIDRESMIGADKRDLVRGEFAEVFEAPEAFRAAVLPAYEDDVYADRVECHVPGDDGREDRWLRHESQPIETGLYAGGRVELYTDVTAHKRRERTLRKLTEEYEAFVENAGDAIFLVEVTTEESGPGFRFQRLNPAHEATSGLSSDDIRGKTPRDVFGDETGAALEANYRRCVEAREPITYEEEIVMPEGRIIWQTKLTPVIVDGTVTRIIGLARDITDRLERERQVRRKNEQLEEFADIVSHDLRNPLEVATGRLDLARAECETEHHEALGRALDRMEALIDDLLTLAREGTARGDVEPVDLGRTVDRCRETVDTGEATLVNEAEQTVRADPSRLRQALANLVRNATEHGGPAVTVRVGDLDGGFYVADDGPGIPEENRDRVFETGWSDAANGTGLGLGIVRQIAVAHGWEVAVTESDAGGARFEITGVDVVS
jgi:PAS domain S-box-containing protein